MSAPRVLLTGLAFPESPRWYDGALWLADWGAHSVLRLDAGGKAEVIAEVPSFPLCFDHLPDGRLLAVDSPRGRLLRREPDGTLVPHASLAEHSPYPWNEVVVDDAGFAFVNGIGFDFPGGDPGPGLVVVVTPEGQTRVVAGDLAFPNGMALTRTGQLLVAESYAGRITAFDVAPDRSLTNRRVWADLGDAAPDGICVDAEGALWFADVPHQQCVRVREGGRVLATVPLDRGAFSCALSGSALYITANDWQGPTAEHAGKGQVLVVDVAVGRA
ncbi:MAG TPA: SMP-30/gluconolactonase/LRE family protein [Mycobacteriales bacterium]|nr:SMP-30/gluconolactonase/LRE family protein [Mycobacteriales bacterium]